MRTIPLETGNGTLTQHAAPLMPSKFSETKAKSLVMDKLKLTGQNLGRVFNFKCGRACLYHAVVLIIKTAKLKVENSAQTTFRFSPVSFCTLRSSYLRCLWLTVLKKTRGDSE